MKSAYERAMEKLEAASGPSKSLNDEQRERIAEIDSKFDSQEAQVKMEFDDKIAQAASATELEALREERGHELKRIEEQREQAKEAVWSED